MNTLLYTLMLTVLLIPHSILAFGFDSFYEPGSSANPIYINGNVQIIETNEQKEDQLIQQYGYSEYNSCRATYCRSTGGDPSLESQCIMRIEAMFQSGLCGRTQPTLQCDQGFTMVDGACIRNDVPPSTSCPLNASFLNGACQCIAGYTANGNTCVKDTVYINSENTSSNYQFDQQCKASYGDASVWTGTNENGSITCDCMAGYAFNDSQTHCIDVSELQDNIQNIIKEMSNTVTSINNNVSNTDTPQAKTDYSAMCEGKFGKWSFWSGKLNDDNGPVCICEDGYSLDKSSTCTITPIKAPEKISTATPTSTHLQDATNSPTVPKNTKLSFFRSFWVGLLFSFNIFTQ